MSLFRVPSSTFLVRVSNLEDERGTGNLEHGTAYFVSLCGLCFRQKRQYLLNSSRSVVFFLFFVVL